MKVWFPSSASHVPISSSLAVPSTTDRSMSIASISPAVNTEPSANRISERGEGLPGSRSNQPSTTMPPSSSPSPMRTCRSRPRAGRGTVPSVPARARGAVAGPLRGVSSRREGLKGDLRSAFFVMALPVGSKPHCFPGKTFSPATWGRLFLWLLTPRPRSLDRDSLHGVICLSC